MSTKTRAPEPPVATRLFNIEGAAEYLCLDERTIRWYIADGRVPAYRVGPRQVRIRQADLERLLVPIPAAGAA